MELLYTALYMPGATRTQVYLTNEQRKRLDELMRRRGATLAELIREAVDSYLAEAKLDAKGPLERSYGAAADFEIPSRHEWDKRERRIRGG
jgi:hypothetical protein